jgi:hypothetical protein
MSVITSLSRSKTGKDLKPMSISNVGGYVPEVAQPIGMKYKFIKELSYPFIGVNKPNIVEPCFTFQTGAHRKDIQSTPIEEAYDIPTGNLHGSKPGLLSSDRFPTNAKPFKKLNNFGFYGV